MADGERSCMDVWLEVYDRNITADQKEKLLTALSSLSPAVDERTVESSNAVVLSYFLGSDANVEKFKSCMGTYWTH